MQQTLALLCLLFLLSGCEGNTSARKAARGPNYVAAPNRIYFKNTRIRHYAADESQEGFIILRHDDLLGPQTILLPAIIDNWLNDQAILRMEIHSDNQSTIQPFRLDLEKPTGWEPLRLTVPPSNQEIKLLRQHLATHQDVRMVMGLDTINPFPGVTRSAAKVVLDDYLRLVSAE
ncbi:MAG: hypothetical protein ACJAZ9_002029 [Neolewinella sp.]|jgi:hypothetical protein